MKQIAAKEKRTKKERANRHGTSSHELIIKFLKAYYQSIAFTL